MAMATETRTNTVMANAVTGESVHEDQDTRRGTVDGEADDDESLYTDSPDTECGRGRWDGERLCYTLLQDPEEQTLAPLTCEQSLIATRGWSVNVRVRLLCNLLPSLSWPFIWMDDIGIRHL